MRSHREGCLPLQTDCSAPVNCGCHRLHHRPPQARRFVAPSPALSEPQGASGLSARLVSSLFEKSRLKQCSGRVFSAMTQFDVLSPFPVRLRTAIGPHVKEGRHWNIQFTTEWARHWRHAVRLHRQPMLYTIYVYVGMYL